MTALHLFQRYSQPENVATNNVLSLFSWLYEYRPKKLERLLGQLVDEYGSRPCELEIGPRFRQQVRGPERVADGLVSQRGFDLLVETKRGGAFDVKQAIGHLSQVKDSPNAVVLLLGRSATREDPSLAPLFAAANGMKNVAVVVCRFGDVIDATRQIIAPYEESLTELLDDFEAFCVESDLLPLDDFTLFVPPCGQSFADNMNWRLYYCPADRPVRAARWLGVYRNRCVEAVGYIDKNVVVSTDAQGEPSIDGVTWDENERIRGALADASRRGWKLLDEPHRFYLCSELVETRFFKDSKGGIPGHRYFSLEALRVKGEALTARVVAAGLNGKLWSEWTAT
jgi:hypothetical protein